MDLIQYQKMRVRNIKKNVSILRVLDSYDIPYRGGGVRVPFSCPFHGYDARPSAMAYEETNSTYCFKCHEALDTIGFVQKKEGMSFSQALYWIEKRYQVPPLPVTYTPDTEKEDLSSVFEGEKDLEGEEVSNSFLNVEKYASSLERFLIHNRDQMEMENYCLLFWLIDHLQYKL